MSGYHKLTGRYKIRTVKNWQIYFGGFSACEIWSNILSLLGISATWPLLCIKYISCKVGKAFNSWQMVTKCPWKPGNQSFFFQKSKEFCFWPFPMFSWNFLDFRKKNDWFPSFHGHLVTVCQLLNAFPTLPDTYFVHKSHQLAELPSRERKFDQILPTEKPQNYVCQFSNGFVLYRPVSLWYPDIELNV